jgi:lipoprotein-releasing system ATP-binding protein
MDDRAFQNPSRKAPSEGDALIRIRNISKGYESSGKKIEILNGLDFDLKNQDTVSIVGASGIGKSTFLHILGTLDRPDSGTILFKGQDVFGFDDGRLAKFRNESIGFVFQFHHLLSDFSAMENVMMPALIKGMKNREAGTLAEEILVRVGLKDRMEHRVTQLSGGEQQRVAIARALVLNPVVLLADEPTGNLDRQNSHKLHNLLLSINEEFNMAFVVVTHNLELASYTARKMTISEGKLVEMG